MIGEVFNKNHHEDILKNSSDMPISVDTQKEKKKKHHSSDHWPAAKINLNVIAQHQLWPKC